MSDVFNHVLRLANAESGRRLSHISLCGRESYAPYIALIYLSLSLSLSLSGRDRREGTCKGFVPAISEVDKI